MATKIFGARGISDCKIMPLVSDDSSGAEYGGLIDLPGMKSLSLEPEMITDELTGDDIVLDRYSKARAYNVSIEEAKISLDAYAAIMGASVETGGFGDDTYSSVTITGDHSPVYVKLIGKVNYVTDEPQGDVWVVLYKCKLNPYAVSFGEEYAAFSASGMAIARNYDKKIKSIVTHSKAKDISSEEFPDASNIEAYTGTTISASPESKVLLAVRVLSATGKGVPYIKVNWAVTSNGDLAGTLNSSFAHTDLDGIAIAEYTTGTGVGDNTVQASVDGLTGSPVTFTITVA